MSQESRESLKKLIVKRILQGRFKPQNYKRKTLSRNYKEGLLNKQAHKLHLGYDPKQE